MHAAGALDDRLDHDRRDLIGVPRGELLDAPRSTRSSAGLAERARRPRREELPRQQAGEQRVHPADRVAERHRAGRVAVVAAAHGHQARAPRAPDRALVLQASLIATSTETEPESARNTRSSSPGAIATSALGELDRAAVRQPAEHHVRHAPELASNARSIAGTR